jgi:hypothetical protein
MSYCRWSTDNFGCDLYCYADVSGGWTTHVAGNRHIGDIPKLPPLAICKTREGADQWVRACKVQSDWLATAARRPIGGPHDGATFNDGTIFDFKARLLMLREAGYRFPDNVLAAVEEEIAEELKSPIA